MPRVNDDPDLNRRRHFARTYLNAVHAPRIPLQSDSSTNPSGLIAIVRSDPAARKLGEIISMAIRASPPQHTSQQPEQQCHLDLCHAIALVY